MSRYTSEQDDIKRALQEALDLIPDTCDLRYIEVWGSDVESIVVLVKGKEAIIISEYDALYNDYIKEGFIIVKDD